MICPFEYIFRLLFEVKGCVTKNSKTDNFLINGIKSNIEKKFKTCFFTRLFRGG